jgi:broad specificity phosphatase PhoE
LANMLSDVVKIAADAVTALAKVLTLDFKGLQSGIVDASKEFEGLVKQFRDGEISALELGNALHRLQEETGFNIELTAAWEQQIKQARDGISRMSQAQMEWTQIMEAQGEETEETTKKIVGFARMTGKELKEWRIETKAAFDTAINSLQDLSSESEITRNDFVKAHQRMLEAAREMATAMREISREKWVNDSYIKFLSEQGPEWLVAFANLTEEQQRKAQAAWEKSRERTDSAKESLDRITGALDKIDRSESKHKVTIEYEYKGFDPTKPGMAGVQRSG